MKIGQPKLLGRKMERSGAGCNTYKSGLSYHLWEPTITDRNLQKKKGRLVPDCSSDFLQYQLDLDLLPQPYSIRVEVR
jgi:hypothetical protein